MITGYIKDILIRYLGSHKIIKYTVWYGINRILSLCKFTTEFIGLV
jgi:hypothetical protein